MLPRHWPSWSVILIGFALIILVILIGLVLEPAAQAVAPWPSPTPARLRLPYAAPLSDECVTCHTDEEKLRESVTREDEIQPMFIEPADVLSVHGRLGCVTCHRGSGGTKDADAAHVELIVDPTLHFDEECLLCHRDMPDEFPEDRLRTPHGKMVHGLMENVTCSDCHGGVGHGFDLISGEVICPMGVCLDCHRERNLDPQLEDCVACHIGPHDVSLSLDCNYCHTSTETWNEYQMVEHPLELVGQHAEAWCFRCHEWPNFKGLSSVCADCHESGHPVAFEGTHPDLTCSACHTPVSFEGATLPPELHPVSLIGAHESAACDACHTQGQPVPEYVCGNCHQPPTEAHFGEMCEDCHTPVSFEGATLPPELHPVSLVGAHESATCDACHTQGQPVPEYVCSNCHQPPPEAHFGEMCEDCHTPISFEGATLPAELHPVSLVGAHESTACDACHTEDQPVPEYVCGNCHQPPDNHLEGLCDACHTPAGWVESAGDSIVARSPQLPHALEKWEDCLACHAEGQMEPAPDDHEDLTNEQCLLCHKAAP